MINFRRRTRVRSKAKPKESSPDQVVMAAFNNGNVDAIVSDINLTINTHRPVQIFGQTFDSKATYRLDRLEGNLKFSHISRSVGYFDKIRVIVTEKGDVFNLRHVLLCVGLHETLYTGVEYNFVASSYEKEETLCET